MALVNAAAGGSGQASPVFRATDEANRNTKFGGTLTPVGTIVASTTLSKVWLKIGTAGTSADWKVIYNTADEVVKGFSGATASWSGSESYKEVVFDISGANLATLTSAIPSMTAGPSFAASVTAVTPWVVARSTTSVTVGVKANSNLASGTVIGVLLLVTGVPA
jgi:hypothetical protein